MGLDIYAGTLTRYYTHNWKTVTQLFAEENGIQIYMKIIEQAPFYLNKNGYLMFELGIDDYDLENHFNSWSRGWSFYDAHDIERDINDVENALDGWY